MKTTLRIFLCAALLAGGLSPAGALSLFGDKKKDAEKPSEEELPGMKPGSDMNAPPRMAQEAMKDKQAVQEMRQRPSSELPPEERTPETAPAERSAPPSGEESAADAHVSESETAVGDHPSGAEGTLPTEVVITGKEGGKHKVNKPALNISVDPFESIRETLKPDQNLLLAESPLTVVWRRTHPEFLKNDRVLQPWRTTFSERPGIVFSPRDQLVEALQRKVEDKEARSYQWSLTVADEEGKVFQHYEGSKEPPEELVWSGQNDQGEWIQAGRAYSPVYMFTDPGGTPYTRVGAPLRYKGIVHQERDGLHITLDSGELWGKSKTAESLNKEGKDLVRSAADLIKRRFTGLPIRIESYAGSKELAERQAGDVQTFFLKELMLLPQDVSTESLRVSFSEQRIEVILLNR